MDAKYFDYAATTPMCGPAIETYAKTAAGFIGNPSANHSLGAASKNELERLRKEISEILNCDYKNLYFTSGGTESDSIILNHALLSVNPGKIIVSRAEHSAVREFIPALKHAGWQIADLPCPNGLADKNTLASMLDKDVRYVFLMAVNNVLGTIQDIKGCVSVVREFEKESGRSIHVHCDAVQAPGKIEINLKDWGVDSAAFSAHKFFGPRGVGYLYCRSPKILPVSRGGGQENGLRPGTENLAGIAASLTALKITEENRKNETQRICALRQKAVCFLKECGFAENTEASAQSPYILNVSSMKIPSEVFVRVMSDKGFCISAGSACHNNSRKKGEGSIAEYGFPQKNAETAVRISFSSLTTEEELDGLLTALKETMNIL